MTILRWLWFAGALAMARADAFHQGGFPSPPRPPGFGRSLGGSSGDNSKCALLIPGQGKSSNFDHALSTFNGIHSPVQEGFTCISFQSVDAAFGEGRDRHGLPRPQTPPTTNDQGNLAVVLLETTRILAKQYNLPRDVLLNGLPLIDTFKTIIGTICPDFIPPSDCRPKKYREYDGQCNNMENPVWGSTHNTFKRRLAPAYADGISAPRVGRDGYPLPSPRVVSAHLHRDEGLHDHAITIMTVAWGQAIDHDLTLTAETKDPVTKKDVKCCPGSPGATPNHPECFPINVPDKDPFYSLFRQNCITMVRSKPGVKYGCKLGPRSQINEITSYIDANWVYGSNEETVNRLRLHRGGLLKSLPVFREYGMKDLLPLKLEDPEDGCIRPNNEVFCFDAGDARVNEQLVLSVIHTMMMREHNRIATELYRINPHWDDHTLFEETRHIISAIIQHITFNEFLPMVLGKEVMQKYGIILEKHGYFDGYDSKIDVTMSANFVTAAFRFGHSLLPSTIERWSPNHKYIASQRLSEMLRQPYDLYKGGWCDQYIMGLCNQVAQAMDDAVTQEVTNHLFQDPGKKWGMDLAAINMQRGREHGIPSYNEFRSFCGLPRLSKFEEMLGYMTNKTVKRYSDVYRHPDDIDLWSGGVSERPQPGSMVGPTFACLIGLTFKELRYGDRFWYENRGHPSSFSLEQLDEVRKVKLSRMICDNSDDIKTMQVYAMVLPDHDINPRVPCASGILPRMDLSKWRDTHGPRHRPQQGPAASIQLDASVLPPKTKDHFRFPNQLDNRIPSSGPPSKSKRRPKKIQQAIEQLKPNSNRKPVSYSQESFSTSTHFKNFHGTPSHGPNKPQISHGAVTMVQSYGPPPAPKPNYGPPPISKPSYGPLSSPKPTYGPPPKPKPTYGPPPRPSYVAPHTQNPSKGKLPPADITIIVTPSKPTMSYNVPPQPSYGQRLPAAPSYGPPQPPAPSSGPYKKPFHAPTGYCRGNFNPLHPSSPHYVHSPLWNQRHKKSPHPSIKQSLGIR